MDSPASCSTNRNTHCRWVQSLCCRYATSTSQCHMRPIRCIALSSFPHLKKKKSAPSLTGDINPQSYHWNNGKMKIAYNSAYVQTETLNFTQQAVVVYFCLFQLPIQEIAMLNTRALAKSYNSDCLPKCWNGSQVDWRALDRPMSHVRGRLGSKTACQASGPVHCD